MPNEILQRAIDIQTPAFDSLLNTIQSETQRIERNRELVRQKEAQIELFEKQQDIQQQNRVELARIQDGLARSRIELQDDINDVNATVAYERQKDLAEYQNQLSIEQYISTTLLGEDQERAQQLIEDIQAAQDEAAQLEMSLIEDSTTRSLYSSGLFKPPASVQAVQDPSAPGTFHYMVNTPDGGRQFYDDYKQNILRFNVLADFIEKLRDQTLSLNENGGDFRVGDATLVSANTASDWIKRIQNAPLEQKEEYRRMIQQRELIPGTTSNVRSLTETADGASSASLETDDETLQGAFTIFEDNFKGVPFIVNRNIPNIETDQIHLIETEDHPGATYGEVRDLRTQYEQYLIEQGLLLETPDGVARNMTVEEGSPPEWESNPSETDLDIFKEYETLKQYEGLIRNAAASDLVQRPNVPISSWKIMATPQGEVLDISRFLGPTQQDFNTDADSVRSTTGGRINALPPGLNFNPNTGIDN